jgi:hypothetical protein
MVGNLKRYLEPLIVGLLIGATIVLVAVALEIVRAATPPLMLTRLRGWIIGSIAIKL